MSTDKNVVVKIDSEHTHNCATCGHGDVCKFRKTFENLCLAAGRLMRQKSTGNSLFSTNPKCDQFCYVGREKLEWVYDPPVAPFPISLSDELHNMEDA